MKRKLKHSCLCGGLAITAILMFYIGNAVIPNVFLMGVQ